MARRLWVRVFRPYFDRLLAGGADPAGSRSLVVRAGQLTSADSRTRLAQLIERTVRGAEHPRWSAVVRPERSAVWAARDDLKWISEILRSTSPVYARGVALSGMLLRDAESPLYASSGAGSAWYWAQLARQALLGHI